MYMKRAADLGNVSAIRIYADMLHEGIGVPKNISKAIEYIKDAADKGHTEAMYNYGVCLEFGDGIEENKEEAAKYYYAASFKGNAEAMVRLAKMIYLGKICNCIFNKILAYDLFCQSAKFGSKEGMLYCALLLREGEVCEVDLKKSTEYFQMAAEKGFSLAYHDYAYCLYYGIGINANKKEASKYLKLAIDDENNIYDIVKKNEIMEFYANMQFYGDGIPINKKEDAKYFKKLADLGKDGAQLKYGEMLFAGDGIIKNQKEAIKYIKQASDNGNSDAQFLFGFWLFTGQGIKIDKEEAIYCFRKSKLKGNINATIMIKFVLNK